MRMSAYLVLGWISLLLIALVVIIVEAKRSNQRVADTQRKVYKLSFPGDLTPEQKAQFLNGISGQMHRKGGFFKMLEPSPSLVFEVGGSADGPIQHWLKVPWQYDKRIIPSLVTTVPGLRAELDETYAALPATKAIEIGAKNSHRQFPIADADVLSANILTALSFMDPGESLRIQWVITPAKQEHKLVYGEAKTREFRLESLLLGPMLASREEVDETNAKRSERTFAAVLRIGAIASTGDGADNLIDRVVGFLKSTNGPANRMTHRFLAHNVQARMVMGASPDMTHPPMLVNVSELAALLAWRPKDLYVAGMPPIVSRTLHTPQNVPQVGGIVGTSTFMNHKRTVAIPYIERTKHVYVSGGTGSGKTTLAENLLAQDMEHGHGVIVIEGKRDLFYRGLERVPKDQIPKTIVVDFSDPSFAVGFNLLQQGDHAVAIDELKFIFNTLFKDRDSMWMVDVLDHALKTLAQNKNGTFMDVMALLRPKPEEQAWAKHLKNSVADQELKDWWDDFDHRDKNREAKIETLKNRVWPMMVAPLMNVFGQSQSTFSMADVIKNNMNLFINLAGMPDMSKRLAGTIFTNAVWTAVQANTVQKSNFLYIDEAQDITQLMADAREMLAKSRSYGLGTFLGNQYIGQFNDDMRDAIISNVQSKLIMHSENPTDNHRLAASFGKMVTPEDFSMLGRFEVLARIATESGTSAPFTMTTLPSPIPKDAIVERLGAHARYESRRNYAKRVDEVRREMEGRRTSSTVSPRHQRLKVSGT